VLLFSDSGRYYTTGFWGELLGKTGDFAFPGTVKRPDIFFQMQGLFHSLFCSSR
jgi:hypothetical protein